MTYRVGMCSLALAHLYGRQSTCANLMQGIICKFEKAIKTNRPKVGTASDRGTHLTLHFIQGFI